MTSPAHPEHVETARPPEPFIGSEADMLRRLAVLVIENRKAAEALFAAKVASDPVGVDRSDVVNAASAAHGAFEDFVFANRAALEAAACGTPAEPPPDRWGVAHNGAVRSMQDRGGSFVASIGRAWASADLENHARLWSAFSHYWKSYAPGGGS